MKKCPHISSINLSSCRGLPRGVKRLSQGVTEITDLKENLGVIEKAARGAPIATPESNYPSPSSDIQPSISSPTTSTMTSSNQAMMSNCDGSPGLTTHQQIEVT